MIKKKENFSDNKKNMIHCSESKLNTFMQKFLGKWQQKSTDTWLLCFQGFLCEFKPFAANKFCFFF
jgi:hypothetical protein